MIDLKKIIYCPLDLPQIPNEITLDVFKKICDYKPPSNKEIVYDWNKKGLYSLTAWNVLKLREKTQNDHNHKSIWFTQNDPGDWHWTEKAKLYAPNLINWLTDNLPFKDMRYCAALSSVGTIKSHSDIPHNATKEIIDYHSKLDPSLYRIVLSGELVESGFYVNVGERKTYTHLPSTSPGWVMGATTCMHGNDDAITNNKILCYAMGELDEQRHYDLIKRSYEKYKEFAILDNQ